MELTQIGRECLSLASQFRGLLDREDDEGQRVRIADLVAELEQVGRETESPIRIGVLGGFSSGKRPGSRLGNTRLTGRDFS